MSNFDMSKLPLSARIKLENPADSGSPEFIVWQEWALKGVFGVVPAPGDHDVPAAHEGWEWGRKLRSSQYIMSTESKIAVIKEIKLSRVEAKSDMLMIRAVGAVLEANYGSSLAKFDRLLSIAQATFPTVTREHTRVVQYCENGRDGIFGLEFEIEDPVFEAPTGWRVIEELARTK